MSTYTPDNWVVLAITEPSGSLLHKIFATWRGGYTTGDYWKLNSGNTKVIKLEDGPMCWNVYNVHGYSGSIYELHKDGYGYSSYSFGVLQNILEKGGDIVKLLSEEESLEYLERMSNERT